MISTITTRDAVRALANVAQRIDPRLSCGGRRYPNGTWAFVIVERVDPRGEVVSICRYSHSVAEALTAIREEAS